MTAIPLNHVSTQPIERLCTGYDGLMAQANKSTAPGHGACPLERYRSGLGFGRFVRFAQERVVRWLFAAVEPFERKNLSRLFAVYANALRNQFRLDGVGFVRAVQAGGNDAAASHFPLMVAALVGQAKLPGGIRSRGVDLQGEFQKRFRLRRILPITPTAANRDKPIHAAAGRGIIGIGSNPGGSNSRRSTLPNASA